jgi:hypothetical protein
MPAKADVAVSVKKAPAATVFTLKSFFIYAFSFCNLVE